MPNYGTRNVVDRRMHRSPVSNIAQKSMLSNKPGRMFVVLKLEDINGNKMTLFGMVEQGKEPLDILKSLVKQNKGTIDINEAGDFVKKITMDGMEITNIQVYVDGGLGFKVEDGESKWEALNETRIEKDFVVLKVKDDRQYIQDLPDPLNLQKQNKKQEEEPKGCGGDAPDAFLLEDGSYSYNLDTGDIVPLSGAATLGKEITHHDMFDGFMNTGVIFSQVQTNQLVPINTFDGNQNLRSWTDVQCDMDSCVDSWGIVPTDRLGAYAPEEYRDTQKRTVDPCLRQPKPTKQMDGFASPIVIQPPTKQTSDVSDHDDTIGSTPHPFAIKVAKPITIPKTTEIEVQRSTRIYSPEYSPRKEVKETRSTTDVANPREKEGTTVLPFIRIPRLGFKQHRTQPKVETKKQDDGQAVTTKTDKPKRKKRGKHAKKKAHAKNKTKKRKKDKLKLARKRSKNKAKAKTFTQKIKDKKTKAKRKRKQLVDTNSSKTNNRKRGRKAIRKVPLHEDRQLMREKKKTKQKDKKSMQKMTRSRSKKTRKARSQEKELIKQKQARTRKQVKKVRERTKRNQFEKRELGLAPKIKRTRQRARARNSKGRQPE